MRKLLWTCVYTGLCASSVFGATINFQNVSNGIWNTGTSSFSSPNLIVTGLGAQDPHYVLIPPASCQTGGGAVNTPNCEEAAGNPFGPNSYVLSSNNNTYPFDGAWPFEQDADGPTSSRWIGPRPDQTNPLAPNLNPLANGVEFYIYRMTFNLGLLGLNSGTMNIQLKWLSDNPDNNQGTSNPPNPTVQSNIRLCTVPGQNNTTQGTCGNVVSVGNPGQGASAFGSTVSIVSAFTTGWYALDFVVYNSIVDGLNPTGLRVQIVSATATDDVVGAVPEPATFGLMAGALLALGLYSRRKQ
jgi:hypothetical protein